VFELQGVMKQFAGQVVLHPLDLCFAAGRVTVLLGQSGCGKSTLLRLLVGLIWPDQGTVRFDGVAPDPGQRAAVTPSHRHDGAGRGTVPAPNRSAERHPAGRHLGWDRDRIARRVAELTELVRLAPATCSTRYPAQLSGGQRQRVALLRTLMLDPPALLLDEPLGALDPMIRADLQTDLRQIFRQLGKTVVVVTHDLSEAGYLGDELILLHQGRVEQRGTLAELTDNPVSDYVTRFVSAQRPLMF
jgi:osmoprotectant transport system ATP-binding protein